MKRILFLVAAFAGALASACPGHGANDHLIAGHYGDEQLAKIKSFTLPRIFLYDEKGALIERANWPAEAAGIKRDAGDVFCCVSDMPPPPGSSGPPPEGQVIVYGADIREIFVGLLDQAGQPIGRQSLPGSRFLVVEYFAAWCPPCVAGHKNLETFFVSADHAREFVWLEIDMTRLLDAQKAARQPDHAAKPAPASRAPSS